MSRKVKVYRFDHDTPKLSIEDRIKIMREEARISDIEQRLATCNVKSKILTEEEKDRAFLKEIHEMYVAKVNSDLCRQDHIPWVLKESTDGTEIDVKDRNNWFQPPPHTRYRCHIEESYRANKIYLNYRDISLVYRYSVHRFEEMKVKYESKMEKSSTSTGLVDEGCAFLKEICALYENGTCDLEEVAKKVLSISKRRQDFEKNFNIDERKIIFDHIYLIVRLEWLKAEHEKIFIPNRHELWKFY